MSKTQTLIAIALTIGSLAVPPVANAQMFWGTGLRNSRKVLAGLKKPVAQAAKSTVRILVDEKAVAFGCAISEQGEILTKASLLSEGEKLQVRTADGSTVEAVRIAVDERYDLALIKAASGKFVPTNFYTDSSPQVGTIVGIASEKGDVLKAGIVTLESGQPRLRDIRQRVRMGVNVAPAEDGGLAIKKVDKESPADRARIRVDDRLISIDGLKVNALNDLLAVLSKYKYGDRVNFRLERGGASKNGTLVFRPRYDRWGGGDYSKRRFTFPKVVFHDIAIKPDECGGPLIDLNGRVIGLNISRALRVATYAIPASEVNSLVQSLRSKNTSADSTAVPGS